MAVQLPTNRPRVALTAGDEHSVPMHVRLRKVVIHR